MSDCGSCPSWSGLLKYILVLLVRTWNTCAYLKLEEEEKMVKYQSNQIWISHKRFKSLSKLILLKVVKTCGITVYLIIVTNFANQEVQLTLFESFLFWNLFDSVSWTLGSAKGLICVSILNIYIYSNLRLVCVISLECKYLVDTCWKIVINT